MSGRSAIDDRTMESSKETKKEKEKSAYQDLYGKTPGQDVAGTPDGEKAKDQAGAFGSAASSPGPESKDDSEKTPSGEEEGNSKEQD